METENLTHYQKYKDTIKRTVKAYYQIPENNERKKAYMREYHKRQREAKAGVTEFLDNVKEFYAKWGDETELNLEQSFQPQQDIKDLTDLYDWYMRLQASMYISSGLQFHYYLR